MSEGARLRRLQRGTAWLREFTTANTPLWTGRSADLDYVKKAWTVLSQCLTQMMSGTLTFAAWQASHAYAADSVIAVGN